MFDWIRGKQDKLNEPPVKKVDPLITVDGVKFRKDWSPQKIRNAIKKKWGEVNQTCHEKNRGQIWYDNKKGSAWWEFDGNTKYARLTKVSFMLSPSEVCDQWVDNDGACGDGYPVVYER